MPAALRAAGYVVKVKHPLDVEWNMLPALEERQVPARVRYLREVNNATVF
jgi:hypothetical protein